MQNYDALRRCDLHRMTELERNITDIMVKVETIGADVRLTDTVVLLNAARNRLADYEDNTKGIRTVPSQIDV